MKSVYGRACLNRKSGAFDCDERATVAMFKARVAEIQMGRTEAFVNRRKANMDHKVNERWASELKARSVAERGPESRCHQLVGIVLGVLSPMLAIISLAVVVNSIDTVQSNMRVHNQKPVGEGVQML